MSMFALGASKRLNEESLRARVGGSRAISALSTEYRLDDGQDIGVQMICKGDSIMEFERVPLKEGQLVRAQVTWKRDVCHTIGKSTSGRTSSGTRLCLLTPNGQLHSGGGGSSSSSNINNTKSALNTTCALQISYV